MNVILRCDDAGSSRSANQAILQVIKTGLVKNVSLMAPTKYIEEFAENAIHEKDINFGIHVTLNAEWDNVKWKPLIKNPIGLVDQDGYFLPHPSCFIESKPQIETIMQEVEAQYNRLVNLGFIIKYLDTHMLPELVIPNLEKHLIDFAESKGILYQSIYDNVVSLNDIRKNNLLKNPSLIVCHPSLDTDEMRLTGNKDVSGEVIAMQRAEETRILLSPELKELFKQLNIATISYSEAHKLIVNKEGEIDE